MILPLQPGDWHQVQALSAALGRTADPSGFNPGHCQLACKDTAGRLLGWAKAGWWDPQDELAPAGYYLGGVEVAPGSQRQGIARRLSDERLAWIAQRAESAWCVVNACNTASIKLQEALGFTVQAEAASFGPVHFTGGAGLLFRKDLISRKVRND